jgi:hypothetical protein
MLHAYANQQQQHLLPLQKMQENEHNHQHNSVICIGTAHAAAAAALSTQLHQQWAAAAAVTVHRAASRPLLHHCCMHVCTHAHHTQPAMLLCCPTPSTAILQPHTNLLPLAYTASAPEHPPTTKLPPPHTDKSLSARAVVAAWLQLLLALHDRHCFMSTTAVQMPASAAFLCCSSRRINTLPVAHAQQHWPCVRQQQQQACLYYAAAAFDRRV